MLSLLGVLRVRTWVWSVFELDAGNVTGGGLSSPVDR